MIDIILDSGKKRLKELVLAQLHQYLPALSHL